MEFNFLHCSDLHFLIDYSKSNSMYRTTLTKMTHPLKQLEILLQTVNEKIDFVLITGDLTHGGEYEDYKELYFRLTNILKKTPFFATPGNHDNKLGFSLGFLKRAQENGQRVDVWQTQKANIIGFDCSSKEYDNGFITEEACKKLKVAISEIKNEKPIFLITHHHLVVSQFELPCATNANRLKELLIEHPIQGIFCGHTHHFYQGTFANIPYFTADSLSFKGDANIESNQIVFYENPGLNIYNYKDGIITVKRYVTDTEKKELYIWSV